MGLIGWIKKEIESTSRQRRQSAPPPISISPSSPNQHRDEAYMRAISKFNEWRNNQRFERHNETKNASEISEAPTAEESITPDDFSIISNVIIDHCEKQRLMEMQRERKKQSEARRVEHNGIFYGNHSSTNNRLSLPIVRKNSIEKPPRQKFKNKSRIHPSETINEVQEFEQNFCHQMEDDYELAVKSPPSKFYRESSDPYADKHPKSTVTKSQSLLSRSLLRRSRNHGKGMAPSPPKTDSQRYERNSTSVYEDFMKASEAYKINIGKREVKKTNSMGESGSSGSLTSEPEKTAMMHNRQSPTYQTVINKHGDEVDYALPYNEWHDPIEPPRLSRSKFDQIINEKFDFLNSKLDLLEGKEPLDNDEPFEPIDTSFTVSRRDDLQVTDLDKSIDNGLVTPAQSGDIIQELDTLSKWTENLVDCKNFRSPLDEYKTIQSNVKIFNAHDIKFKSGILRNSFSTPLEFSNGYFHSTPVTLRSTLPNVYSINSFADTASKREMEILSQMRHQSIVVLMGIFYDSDLRVMSLVTEPFDYSLNHYLHQMDQYFSIQETISIVQQIGSAAQYLHDCGYVHSNISSHAVLIRETPFAVKLSSFELTTEIKPRKKLDRFFLPPSYEDGGQSLMITTPASAEVAEKYYKLSKQHFYNRTSLPIHVNAKQDDSQSAYSVVYRRMFSMHFYQPPELLIASDDEEFRCVLPTVKSDIFSLALLLWESLNHCVPFATFNHDDLIVAYEKNKATLPLLDKSSTAFMEIFDACIRVEADERVGSVDEFMTMLNEIYRIGDGIKVKSKANQEFDVKRSLNQMKVNVREKNHCTKTRFDPQKRSENAIRTENIVKENSKISESIRSFESRRGTENKLSKPKENPGKLNDTVEDLNFSKRSINSTLYQSFFDSNRLNTPKIDKDVIYDRTSTLKKRLKVAEKPEQKKSVKELFEGSSFDRLNNELSQIPQDYSKTDFMNEVLREFNDRRKSEEETNGVSSLLNRGMLKADESQSLLPDDSEKEKVKCKKDFLVGDYSLPSTPIARKNKLRRNAWLSDSKKHSGGPSRGRFSDTFLGKNKPIANDSSNNEGKVNGSIKFHGNDLDLTPKTDNFQNTPKERLEIANNVDLSHSRYKKYYPMMPEMLSDVIQGKRDRSGSLQLNQSEGEERFEKNLWRREIERCHLKSDVEEKVVVPARTCVRDAVKVFESTIQSPQANRIASVNRSTSLPRESLLFRQVQPLRPSEEVKKEILEFGNDNPDKNMTKSVEKNGESLEVTPKMVPTVSSSNKNDDDNQIPSTVTTKVTVNLKKIMRRKNDVRHSKEDELNQASFNTELIKKIQMHFKTRDLQKSSFNKCPEAVISSASCGSLMVKDSKSDLRPMGKCQKYFCRNCGFTMIPVDVLQKLQNGRLSIASNLARSLQSIKFDEGSQTLKSKRKCFPINETKSTEDLYIDDDFCQDVSDNLGANMELLSPPELFDSMDFNFLSAEIFHTQDYEFDCKLTEDEKMQLEWHCNEHDEMAGKALIDFEGCKSPEEKVENGDNPKILEEQTGQQHMKASDDEIMTAEL